MARVGCVELASRSDQRQLVRGLHRRFYSTALTNADGSFFNVPSTVTHNLSAAYDFGDDNRWLKGTEVRLGVRNLFDKLAPLYPGSFGGGAYSGSIYIPYGRYLYLDVKKSF